MRRRQCERSFVPRARGPKGVPIEVVVEARTMPGGLGGVYLSSPPISTMDVMAGWRYSFQS